MFRKIAVIVSFLFSPFVLVLCNVNTAVFAQTTPAASEFNETLTKPAATDKKPSAPPLQPSESLAGKTNAPVAQPTISAPLTSDIIVPPNSANGASAAPKYDINALRVGAENGNVDAELRLSYAYYKGIDGAPKDDAKSIELLKKAAEVGDPRAQYRLSAAYFHGDQAVKQDYVRSYMWLTLMINQHNAKATLLHKKASLHMQALENVMTRKQIQEGKDQAKMWVQQHSFLAKEFLPQ